MDTAIVQQFLNLFQDYINLCQLNTWPDNTSTENEIKNALLMSKHIEKCLDRLQKRGLIDDYLTVLNNKQDIANNLLKNCLTDPGKYILKKIITSNTNITQVDIGFRLFLEIFTEEKLENCLADLMLEAASKDTLLKNINKEISKESLLIFKSKLFLAELSCSDCDILGLVDNCEQNIVELLVVGLINTEHKYSKTIKCIADALLTITNSKDVKYKQFWRSLLNVFDKYFIEMCVENPDIFCNIVAAMLDCKKLIEEGMSSESFYIDLSEAELLSIAKKIFLNDCLKGQFFCIVQDNDGSDFWNKGL